MNRIKVKSSNIASVGYDEASQILEVEFKGSGKTYQYAGVSPETYSEMMSSESVGRYFAMFIRDNYNQPE